MATASEQHLIARGPFNDELSDRVVPSVIDIYTERANLYPLAIQPEPENLYEVAVLRRGRQRFQLHLAPREGASVARANPAGLTRALNRLLGEALTHGPFKLSNDRRLVIDTAENLAPAKASLLRLHRAYEPRVMHLSGRFYLCIGYQVRLRNTFNLAKLRQIEPTLHLKAGQHVFVRDEDDSWIEARFLDEVDNVCRLEGMDDRQEIVATPDSILPELERDESMALAAALGVKASELEQRLKEVSLLTVSHASRIRLQTTNDFAVQLAEKCFPLVEDRYTVALDANPVRLMPPRFVVGRDLSDPRIALDHEDNTKRASDILDGLTRFGTYEKPGQQLRLALLAPTGRMPQMRTLVERLNRGADRYTGAERTFGVSFNVMREMPCRGIQDYEGSIRQFVREPDREYTDVLLAYMPRGAHPGRPDHPYFRTKKQLLTEGLASQMLDDATLLNPRFKDLNLGLNIFAKAGHVPWVLDEGIDDVDLFIGLSYTTAKTDGRTDRMMAYANIFDRYGRWRFYQGDGSAFAFEDRVSHFSEMISNSIAAYRAQSASDRLRTVHVHYTKRFSHEEMETIAEAIKVEIPNAQIAFVAINVHHPLRLFDIREDGDGSISRALHLPVGPSRTYVTTTGANQFSQRGMGTPIPLELSVWRYPREYELSLDSIAQHAVALTRLNWASTRPFCREPITTKFAGDIAYAMEAFMDDPSFSISPALRSTPWFL